MNKTLFIFIKPDKFSGLIKDEEIQRNWFKSANDADDEEEQGVDYIRNEVIYVSRDSTKNKGLFDAAEIENACGVFISDEHERIENYSPMREFKILHHTADEPQNLQNELKNHKFYRGWEEKAEESETYYGDLARAFIDGNLAETIKEIYEQIPDFNRELEDKLELLHNCLLPKKLGEIKQKLGKIKSASFLKEDFEKFLSDVRKIKLPGEKTDIIDEQVEIEEIRLTDEQIKEIAWDNPKYIENLRNFRTVLLGS
jgi:hypothetical protein